MIALGLATIVTQLALSITFMMIARDKVAVGCVAPYVVPLEFSSAPNGAILALNF